LNALGRHLLVELNDCDREVLNDLELLRDAMLTAAIKSGAVILGDSFHRFSPPRE
jgi:S-adenosylmethionine decarboxylase